MSQKFSLSKFVFQISQDIIEPFFASLRGLDPTIELKFFTKTYPPYHVSILIFGSPENQLFAQGLICSKFAEMTGIPTGIDLSEYSTLSLVTTYEKKQC